MIRRKKPSPKIVPSSPRWPRQDIAVAEEAGGQVGLLLWLRVRDVALWAATPPEERRGLFRAVSPEHEEWERDAAGVEALAPAIRTLAALVRYPELLTGTDAAAACSAISAWATATGKPEAALHFAEAAALADPLNARLCAEAGTACVVAASSTSSATAPQSAAADAASREADRRAQIWFDRGIKVGRWTRQWEWYIRCRIRAGMQAYELGEYRRAMRSYRGARSTAIWRGFPDLAGKAHHAMMLIECAVGTYERAEANLNAALASYPVRYQRLPHLAHDAAYMFVCWGAFHAAMELLETVYPLIDKATERVAVMGTLARAAAGIGNRTRYQDAVADVLLYAALSDVNAAAALVLAAEGALEFSDWRRSAELASYGLRIAERRREREPQLRAKIVLERAAAQKIPEYPSIEAERIHRTTLVVLGRLSKLRAPTNPDGAQTELRAELTKFTMSAR